METSTSAFFRPPDSVLRSTAIPAVVLPNGAESSDPVDIGEVFKHHWGSIFGDERYAPGVDGPVDEAAVTLLLDSIVRRLGATQAAALDEPITADELAATIKHLRRESAPGLDGLGPALYMLAPDAFGKVLAAVFASELEHGRLLSSQRKSCVSLLYKKGDRRDPGNYRPISLMQVDVKILSKTLAYRLQRFLPTLIHTEQKGFVRGRSLHHHVRFIQDLQRLIRRRGDQGFALFLDFAKAYDRVNWDYLFRVLERVGCGPGFRRWIQLLYSDVQAVLSVNGSLQEILFPTRGVKQGDPLSSLLFLLSIEPLGNLLRSAPEHGISVSTDFTATGLYFADDSTLLSISLAGLSRQVEIVQRYCAGSGARLNLAKSQLLAFHGAEVSAPTSLVGVATSESVKYLGIPIGHHVTDECVCAALEARVGTRLARWGPRARTYRGRLLILQAMVLSVLWHFTPHFSLPDAMVKRLQSLSEQYLLTRRGDPSRHFVKLAKPSICYPSFCKGGLQIPHLATIFRVQRLRMLQQLVTMPDNEPWRATIAELRGSDIPGGSTEHPFDFITCPYNVRSAVVRVDLLSTWWKRTWKAWSTVAWFQRGDLVDPVHFQASLLRSYIWHSTHPLLMLGYGGEAPATLLGKPGATRKFRIQFAAETGCRCLHDFMSAGWPEAPAFLSRFMLVASSLSLPYRIRHLMNLYVDLSSIYGNVTRSSGLYEGPCILTPSLPLVGVRRQQQVILFPRLQKTDVWRLIGSPQFAFCDHPLTHQVSGINASKLAATIAATKLLRSLVLPVYSDLQFRLSWMLLPTRSRFYFLRIPGSSDLACGYPDCVEVETAQHLFLDCSRAAALWAVIMQDWANFVDGSVSWAMICTLEEPHWAPGRVSSAEQLSLLWMITRCIVIHVIWTARNKHQFEDKPPLDPPTAIYRVYSVFGAHVRALLRSSDQPTRARLRRCLRQFPTSSCLGRFIATHPRLFNLRQPALYTNASGRLRAPPL